MPLLRRNVQRSVLHGLRLLIDILSLSDEDSDHVEVSILAGSPNVLKGMLAIVALAQVERQFVLRCPYISEHIVVSLPLEKGVADGGVAIV